MSDLAWTQGMSQWTPIGSIPTLSATPVPLPPNLLPSASPASPNLAAVPPLGPPAQSAAGDVCYEVNGHNGQITLRRKRLIIARKSAIGFLTHGLAGAKEIPIRNVKSVQFKEAGALVNGFIQFGILGGNEAKGGVFDATKDENTVMFRKSQQAHFREIKRYIDSVLDEEPIDFDSLNLPRERQSSASPTAVAAAPVASGTATAPTAHFPVPHAGNGQGFGEGEAVFLGLNQNGVLLFVALLLFCFPVAFVPWLIPACKAQE